VSGYGKTRRFIVRIAVPFLALLLAVTATAVPAQAASTGAVWSKLMRQKLDLATESTRLTAQLPALKVAAGTRNTNLTRARQTQTAAASALATATTADQTAHLRYVTAKTAVATAKAAITTAQKRRPLSTSRVIAAKRVLTKATATLQIRAATTGKAAMALKVANTAQTTATKQLAAATTAAQTAARTISNTQLRIASLPALAAALGTQAVAIRSQVVVQTRASFTIAQTTKVNGITVNKIIAYPFQRMIDDAARAGVRLSGGGFRTKQQQIALRTINKCPDVWTAPASSCKVPTAIPGRSLHELGLAIDLTTGGKTISSHNSPAYKWLAAHAAKYGFVNLPSEAWHWSITGS
jgi:zinc D-Ala-D-Ala carboxypeptidase